MSVTQPTIQCSSSPTEPAISASESPTSRICAESATGAVSLKCHDARPRPRLPSVETGKPSSEQLGDLCKCEVNQTICEMGRANSDPRGATRR